MHSKRHNSYADFENSNVLLCNRKSLFKLRYFSFDQSLKLRWCSAQELNRFQIPGITERFELKTCYMECTQLNDYAIGPNKLGIFAVSKFTNLRLEQTILVDILQINFMVVTAMVSCSMFKHNIEIYQNLQHDIMALSNLGEK